MSVARFGQVMNATELRLDEACLAISSSLQAPIDEIEWLTAIEMLAGECPASTPDGVASYLFRDLGFRGNSRSYYDWRNSCLDYVLTARTGIPITLSVLMIEIGRRVGVPLVGVGLPAHFLVRDAGDPERFFDPYGGGAELDRAGARALFDRVTDGRIPWQDSFLEPTIGQAIVVRILNNLRSIFAGRGDRLRLGIVMQLRLRIPQLSVAEADAISLGSAPFN